MATKPLDNSREFTIKFKSVGLIEKIKIVHWLKQAAKLWDFTFEVK